MPRTASTRGARVPATISRAFLFSDLRGYTDFVERKGDAAAARLLRDYRTLVRREVARHDGAEVKTEGDSFYVAFPSAGAALECAVAIQRRAAARNERDPQAPLTVGMGIHAGETVAFDQQFVGSAVNVAARLASQAGPGEIVVSDTVRGLVRTSTPYDLRARGELELKGVSERIRAWTVSWGEQPAEPAPEPAAEPLPAQAVAPQPPVAAASAPGQLVCPVVVGRDSERARALELIEAARAGHGQTLLVAGEAGVGKSALVRDVTARAVERGFRVLYGPTLEADSGLPYAPFIAAVRSGFRGLDRERLGRVLTQAAPDLAELFPELGRPRAQADAAGDQHRLAIAFHGLFATFAREAPVLLVVEDLHWADEASYALVLYLARELRDARVLMLATFRSDEMHRRHPFLRLQAALQRERLVTEVQLRRLTKDEVAALIQETFRLKNPVSPEFRDAIYDRSEGNPFFTEELLRTLVDSGDVYRTDTGWGRKEIAELKIPGSIREAVRARVERLSEDARATLATAAVVGLQFTFGVLQRARGIGEDAVEAHLREFIEQQLVVEVAGSEERYAFRHALTKEVVYDDLLVRERKRVHRAVAEALEADRETEPALLAHHLLAAGERERAIPHLLAAGDRAAQAGAPREAAAHYARAVEIGLPDEQLAGVVERQAEAYHSFDMALAIKSAEEALALYREAGDRLGESRMLRLAGRGHFYEGRPDEAERLTQQAIDVAGEEETPELARAIAQQAGLLMARTAMADAVPLADRAIELARRTGDAWALANALISKGSALPGDEGVPFIREGIDVGVREGVVEAAIRGYNNLFIAMIPLGLPVAERRTLLAEALAYARGHGVEQASLAYLRSQESVTLFGIGEWDAAVAAAGEVHEASIVHRWATALRLLQTIAREGPEAALPVAAEFEREIAGAERIGGLADLSGVHARAGRIDDARRYVERLHAVLAQQPRGDGVLRTPRSALGGPSLPSVLTAALLADAPELVDIAEAEIWVGPMAPRARAMVEATRAVRRGDAPAAAAALERAAEGYEITGMQAFGYEYIVTCVRTLRARGATLGPEWRALAAKVRAFAEKVGARWWLSVLDEAGL